MTESQHGILIVGFGKVGQGFFELFNRKKEIMGLGNVSIKEVVDLKYGYFDHPEKIDVNGLLTAENVPEPLDVIKNSSCDVVCDFTSTNYESGDPGYTYIKTALSMGKDVISTNKGALALHYDSLMGVARSKKKFLGYKGTVMSGTPSFNILDLIHGVKVNKFRGILSGTTNKILEEMSYGKSFSQAFKQAQESPHGDVNPSYDASGVDSAAKNSIISKVLGWDHSISDIETVGIENLNTDDAKSGVKLVAYADQKTAYVKPVRLRGDDLLRSVTGTTNALEFDTDTLGKIYCMGPGTGKYATAQAALSDLYDLVFLH